MRTVGEFLSTPKFSHWETLPALPHGQTGLTLGFAMHLVEFRLQQGGNEFALNG